MVAAMPPMTDPTAIPAMALVLRPIVAFVVKVDVVAKVEPEIDVNVEVVANAEPKVEVAIVDVELFELSIALAIELLLGLEFETDCVDEVLGIVKSLVVGVHSPIWLQENPDSQQPPWVQKTARAGHGILQTGVAEL